MTRLPLALVAVAALATGTWLLQDDAPDQPTRTSSTDTNTSRIEEPAAHAGDSTPKLDPETIAANLKAEREKERRAKEAATESMRGNQLGFDPWTTPESTIYQVHHTQDMARLRWEKNTEKGRFVTTWFRKKDQIDSRLMEEVAEAHGENQLAAMRSYNEHTDTKRRELTQFLGLADANHVLDTFAIYKFDLEKRNWYRVNASGQKVPFLHDDDDIWSDGETNGASWDNHRH